MKTIKKIFNALGTINTITILYNDELEISAREAVEHISKRVEELDDRFSVFKVTSEISRINANAGKDYVTVSQETYRILSHAVRYGQISNGTFDITIRPLTGLWGIGKKGDYVPPQEEINVAKQLVDFREIHFDNKKYRIGLRLKGQAIDLGGIAKGYAADEAKRILLEYNIFNAIINFGGTIIGIGDQKKVGIQNPLKPTGTPMGVLLVQEEAVVTSGWYERYFMKYNQCYHHIINPITGRPSESDISSITLVGRSAMELDAVSTAVFILGMEKGMELLHKCNLDGIFVLHSKEVFVTKGIENKFSLIRDKEVFQYA